MRIDVHAVGRMKAGPERGLAERYLERFARSAPQLGMSFGGVAESAESPARSAAARREEEARRLRAVMGDGASLVLLDEHGRDLGSERFAAWMAERRDGGTRRLLFAIGGADGHDPSLRAEAVLALSFGAATWPHQLVRIMLAEQLYRAATILSGHPYHRA